MMLKVTPRGFEPMTTLDRELHAAFKVGDTVYAEVKKRKNPKLLRLYWAVLTEVAPNTPYPDTETLSNVLLLHTGRIRGWKIEGYAEVSIAQRISEMDHDALKQYWDEAKDVIYKEWGIDVDMLERRNRNMVIHDGTVEA